MVGSWNTQVENNILQADMGDHSLSIAAHVARGKAAKGRGAEECGRCSD